MAAAAAATRPLAPPRSLHELVVGPGFEPARQWLAPFYRLRRETALCKVPPSVAEKYGKDGERQHVITVTDRFMHRQTCWNPQRGNKPQNFTSSSGGGGGADGRLALAHHALDPLSRPPPANGSSKKPTCDFCDPLRFTAEDAFGRYSSSHGGANARAVTASNLFKCAAPYHGVVVLAGERGHDPLAFRRADVGALLDCARGWFALAAADDGGKMGQTPTDADADADERGGGNNGSRQGAGGAAAERRARRRPLHPFLLWNALPRAGASQFHGHAQVMLASDPVPDSAQLWRAERAFARQARRERRRRRQEGSEGDEGDAGRRGGSSCYYSSLLRAKAAAGLLRVVTAAGSSSGGGGGGAAAAGAPSLMSWAPSSSSASLSAASLGGGGRDEEGGVAYVYASLAPVKDAELVVVVPAPPAQGRNGGGGGGGGGNLDALRSPALARAFHAALRAVVDGVGGGSGAFNAAVHNLEVASSPVTGGQGGPGARAAAAAARQAGGGDSDSDSDSDSDDDAECGDESPPPWPERWGDDDDSGGANDGDGDGSSGASAALPPPLFPRGRPLVARVVGRGAPSAVASDFGALEVLGGASIGHTDPYALMAMFDAALEQADARGEEEGAGEEGAPRRSEGAAGAPAAL